MNEINIAEVDALVRDIFLAFVRAHVLYHAADGPVYGAAMMEELAHHGYEIGPGTMYPTFHALRRQGYLNEERRVVGGKVRKYYRITETGRHALALLRQKLWEFLGEVLNEERERDDERHDRHT